MKVNYFLLIFSIITGILLTLLLFWDLGLRFNTTASLPKGLYQLSTEKLQRGDFITFCIGGKYANMARERRYLGNGICPSGVKPLLKVLVGMPGDEITIDANGIHIMQKYQTITSIYPLAKAVDSQGRNMRSILSSGTIPKNMGLVMTKHTGGFDSRYFGFVSLVSLSKVKVLLTF